jgi:hypothetical protein
MCLLPCHISRVIQTDSIMLGDPDDVPQQGATKATLNLAANTQTLVITPVLINEQS